MTDSQRRYEIKSQASRAFYTITRLSDGASVFLQGDDAGYFRDDLLMIDRGFGTSAYLEDDLCDEYFNSKTAATGKPT